MEMRDGKVKGMRRTLMVEIIKNHKTRRQSAPRQPDDDKNKRGEGLVCKQMCVVITG